MVGAEGGGSLITLASMSALKSARRMRTRRPMCNAGSFPWSIQLFSAAKRRTRAYRERGFPLRDVSSQADYLSGLRLTVARPTHSGIGRDP